MGINHEVLGIEKPSARAHVLYGQMEEDPEVTSCRNSMQRQWDYTAFTVGRIREVKSERESELTGL